jgi:hypothetical protein
MLGMVNNLPLKQVVLFDTVSSKYTSFWRCSPIQFHVKNLEQLYNDANDEP